MGTVPRACTARAQLSQPHPLTRACFCHPMLSGSPIAGEACRDPSWLFLHCVTRHIPFFLYAALPLLCFPLCYSVSEVPGEIHLCHTLSQVSSSTIKMQLIQGLSLITGQQENKYGGLECGVDTKTMKSLEVLLKKCRS